MALSVGPTRRCVPSEASCDSQMRCLPDAEASMTSGSASPLRSMSCALPAPTPTPLSMSGIATRDWPVVAPTVCE